MFGRRAKSQLAGGHPQAADSLMITFKLDAQSTSLSEGQTPY